MISARANSANMILGQIKTEEKSNEITAIPKLIKILELKGCIVTIDAMGTQKEIAKTIIDSKADYVLALKENQNTLYEDVKDFFDDSLKKEFEGYDYDNYKETNNDYGRYDICEYIFVKNILWCIQPKKMIRHICLNLLKQEKTHKAGLKSKRLKAGWNDNYREKVLFNL